MGLASCTVPALENVEGKQCPCAEGFACDTPSARCLRTTDPTDAGNYDDDEDFDEDWSDDGLDGGNWPPEDAAWPQSPVLDAGPGDAATPADGGADAGTPPAEAGTDAGTPDVGTDAGPVEPCLNELLSGERMYVGEYRCSPSGEYRFGLGATGDLELRRGDLVVWSAGICCSAYRVTMQVDGNLVVRDALDAPIWATATAGKTGARLRVEDDGRAVVWFNGTVAWSTGITP